MVVISSIRKLYTQFGTFLANNKLAKIDNLENIYSGQEITPLEIFHPNLNVRSPVIVEISFLG